MGRRGAGVVFWIVVAIALLGNEGSSGESTGPPHPKPALKPKRYVMRGYGGGRNTTSVHPRQQKRGRTIAYIPGVGYRHVQKRKPK